MKKYFSRKFWDMGMIFVHVWFLFWLANIISQFNLINPTNFWSSSLHGFWSVGASIFVGFGMYIIYKNQFLIITSGQRIEYNGGAMVLLSIFGIIPILIYSSGAFMEEYPTFYGKLITIILAFTSGLLVGRMNTKRNESKIKKDEKYEVERFLGFLADLTGRAMIFGGVGCFIYLCVLDFLRALDFIGLLILVILAGWVMLDEASIIYKSLKTAKILKKN